MCEGCSGRQSGWQDDFWKLGYGDLIGILSFVVGLKNLAENEQQSQHSEQLIKQIDVDAANDRQAHALLEELGQKFEEQNAMLCEILEVLKVEKSD